MKYSAIYHNAINVSQENGYTVWSILKRNVKQNLNCKTREGKMVRKLKN